MTLQLRDRSGRLVEVAVVPRAPVVIGVHLSPDISTAVRRVVHADLIRRAVEHHRGTTSMVSLGEVPEGLAELASDLNCRPMHDSRDRCHVVVGPGPNAAESASFEDIVSCRPPNDGDRLPDRSGTDLRHALLARDDGSARGEVIRWQRAVASWAESPSKPMCADYVERAHAAMDDDLDTPTLLRVMRELEEHAELPPGSKFETFAHLDALIGLDLVSRVGQPG